MELKIKSQDGDAKNTNTNTPPVDDFSDLEQTAYTMTSTDVQYSMNRDLVIEKKKESPIVKYVIYILAIIIIAVVGKTLYDKYANSTKDITYLLKSSESAIASDLGITFADAPNEVSGVYQYTNNGKITVQGSPDLSIIYINGKQTGIKINSKAYSVYNLKIGDPEYKIDELTNYNYDDCFDVINNIGGASEESFYYNRANNDCLLIITSNNSGRIVSITYYNDFKKISETLSDI